MYLYIIKKQKKMKMHESLIRSLLGLNENIPITPEMEKRAMQIEQDAETTYFKQHPELNP